jgi:S1-C subfamily serine protease
MKTKLTILGLICAACLWAKPKESPASKEPVVVLPTFVVIGTRIPSSWLEVAWECRGPMPIDRVKRAWISKVQAGSPAAEAGFKVGDNLLAMGSIPVEAMSGVTLQSNLQREREFGTREEFILQTPGKEKRTVVILFAKH